MFSRYEAQRFSSVLLENCVGWFLCNNVWTFLLLFHVFNTLMMLLFHMFNTNDVIISCVLHFSDVIISRV